MKREDEPIDEDGHIQTAILKVNSAFNHSNSLNDILDLKIIDRLISLVVNPNKNIARASVRALSDFLKLHM